MLGESQTPHHTDPSNTGSKDRGLSTLRPGLLGASRTGATLPYFASYCIRTFDFPISYFRYVTGNISTHDSRDKGISWWGAGGVLPNRMNWAETEQRFFYRGHTGKKEDGKNDRDVHLHEKDYHLDAESSLCFHAPQHREGRLGTALVHNAPHGGSCRQQHRGGDTGGLTSETRAGRTPTAPHALRTQHRTCSWQQDSRRSNPLVRV